MKSYRSGSGYKCYGDLLWCYKVPWWLYAAIQIGVFFRVHNTSITTYRNNKSSTQIGPAMRSSGPLPLVRDTSARSKGPVLRDCSLRTFGITANHRCISGERDSPTLRTRL